MLWTYETLAKMAEYIQRFWNTLLGRVSKDDFWATPVNRKWIFCILGRQVCLTFWANRLYKSKETWQRQRKLKGERPHFRLTHVTQNVFVQPHCCIGKIAPQALSRRLIFTPFSSTTTNNNNNLILCTKIQKLNGLPRK